jgi:type III secretory pathway component EscV
MQRRRNIMAVAGLVLGILSLCGGWIPGVPVWVLGILGIILSAVARSKAQKTGQPTGVATAGLVLSIIGTVLSLSLWIACTLCVVAAGAAGSDILNNLGDYLNF